MPDSLYYTTKLQSVAVRLLANYPPYAIVETASGKRYNVLAHRVLPLREPRKSSLPRNLVDRRPPKNYVSIPDFVVANNLSLNKDQLRRFANLCGRECSKSGVKSWKTNPDARNRGCYFPIEIINTVFAKLKLWTNQNHSPSIKRWLEF